jgi:hypothetical protein
MFFQFHPSTFIYFLNLISIIQSNPRLVEIWSRLSQEKNKRRKKEEACCPTGLIHCGCVHCLGHQFRGLWRVNIMCCYLFILLHRFLLRFNSLTDYCFTFELGLVKGWNDSDFNLFLTWLSFKQNKKYTLVPLRWKSNTSFYLFINAYDSWVCQVSDIYVKFLILISNILSHFKK